MPPVFHGKQAPSPALNSAVNLVRYPGKLSLSAKPECGGVGYLYGSSPHLMKNGQNFGILVLIWDLSGIDDTQT
jgi:hypothetical protein